MLLAIATAPEPTSLPIGQLLLIFLAALALPLALNVTSQKPESPGPLPDPF